MYSLTMHGKVMVLTFIGNEEHWLNPQFLGEIASALSQVESHPNVAALVTTNEGNFFSNGLDLAYMRSVSPELVMGLIHQLEHVSYMIMSMKVPTIAAICGHVCGAGLQIALAHDHQFMCRDRGFVLMTAIKSNSMKLVGQLPPGSFTLPRMKMSPRSYKELFLEGEKYTAVKAADLGLIDGSFENASETMKASLAKAFKLVEMDINKETYVTIRKAIYGDAMKQLEASHIAFLKGVEVNK